MRAPIDHRLLAGAGLLAAVLLGSAGCGGAAQIRWNLRFATAGGRGLLVLHTRDVEVAERVTMKMCELERTELLAESENSKTDERDFRAVFPLTPRHEACLSREGKVHVALDPTRPGGAAPQQLKLDEWSAQRIYERVQERALGDLDRATTTAKQLDPEKYLVALDEWIRTHPRSLALEQARKEAARVRAELEAERRAAAEKARAEAARRRAEENRRAYVVRAFELVNTALQAGDAARAGSLLDEVTRSLAGDAEQNAARGLRARLHRLRQLAEVRARFAPKLAPRPRKLYLQRRVFLHELPDPKSPTTVELEEGDEVWALAGAPRAMVGIARVAGLDLATILAGGVKLEQVEGWVEAGALTPKDRWAESRHQREERERTLFAGRSAADRADLKRLLGAGPVVSPNVQLGLLRRGYAAAETRRLALLLDAAIRAAADPSDPRMPSICSGLARVVRQRGLSDCAAAARAGASDENVAAIARDFGRNTAGFASTFSLAREDLARLIMTLATAP